MSYLIILEKDPVLQIFADEVSLKRYSKIPYPVWRELSRAKEPYLGSFSATGEESQNILLIGEDKTYNYFGTYNKDDGSLGSFLKTPYIYGSHVLGSFDMKEGESLMSVISNVVLEGVACSNPCPATSSTTITTKIPYSTTSPTTTGTNYIYTYPSTDYIINNCTNKCSNCENYKEKDTMNTKNMFNFDFGPAAGTQFRLSPCGLAIATKDNGWITYDPKTGDLMDANIINFDLTGLIYKMPVALAAIHPGDILMHSGKPVFVKSVNGDNTITAINYADATVVNILPVKSPFGFNFFTKICALVDFSGMTASQNQPFGNMLPFLLMQNGDFDPMMLLLMNGNGMDFTSNPMMLYFLAKDNKDMLPFLLMMGNQASPTVPTPEPQTI